MELMKVQPHENERSYTQESSDSTEGAEDVQDLSIDIPEYIEESLPIYADAKSIVQPDSPQSDKLTYEEKDQIEKQMIKT